MPSADGCPKPRPQPLGPGHIVLCDLNAFDFEPAGPVVAGRGTDRLSPRMSSTCLKATVPPPPPAFTSTHRQRSTACTPTSREHAGRRWYLWRASCRGIDPSAWRRSSLRCGRPSGSCTVSIQLCRSCSRGGRCCACRCCRPRLVDYSHLWGDCAGSAELQFHCCRRRGRCRWAV